MMAGKTKFVRVARVVVFTVAAMVAARATACPIYDGLVGYWKFDGNYSDASLTGNVALAVPGTGTVAFATGQVGQALSVSAPAYVRTVNNLVVSGQMPRTVNVWFNPAAAQTQAALAAGTGANGRIFDLYLRTSPTQFGGHFYGGNYDTLVGANPTYAAGQWTMATLVYDGDQTVDVYRNGEFFKSTTLPGPLNTGATPLFFGGGGGYGGTQQYAGMIDDVAVWNRVLTAGEIAAVYQANSGGTSLGQNSPLAVQFDMGSGGGSATGAIGPAQWLGAMTGGSWNVVTGHLAGATVNNEHGVALANPVTLQFGSAASGSISNWGTVATGQGNNMNGPGGVHGTALMTDFVYTTTNREIMGTRVSGLPAGTYDVFAMPRHGVVEHGYSVAIDANIDTLTGNAFTNPGGAASADWVVGTSLQTGNVFRKRVTISGPTDNIAVLFDNLGSGSTEIMGLQIVQVADPTPPQYFRVQFDAGRTRGVPYGPVGPGHAVGLFAGNQWNALSGNFTGTIVDEFGNPLPGQVTVQFAANNGAQPLTSLWGTGTVADWSGFASGLTGVNASEMMRDALYISSGSREVMGIRIGGLPTGLYEVLMMPKYADSISAQRVAIGANLDDLASGFVSPAGAFNTWVEGTDAQSGNYYRKQVVLHGTDDWITMIFDNLAYSSTEFMGFQIAWVGIPEPSSALLLLTGLLLLFAARRRRG